MGKICYDCATEKINGICPNCYPDEARGVRMNEKIKEIQSVIDEIEQILFKKHIITVDKDKYLEDMRFLLSEVKRLQREIEDKIRDKQNAIDYWVGEVKRLREGIEKHRYSPERPGWMKGNYYPKDEELYKLLEEKKP